MSFTEQIITIAAVVAGTMLTRFLPFILFPANKKRRLGCGPIKQYNNVFGKRHE